MRGLKKKIIIPQFFIFDFQSINSKCSKNIVEKCGKVLTYSHFLYFCSVFWHENGRTKRAEIHFRCRVYISYQAATEREKRPPH